MTHTKKIIPLITIIQIILTCSNTTQAQETKITQTNQTPIIQNWEEDTIECAKIVDQQIKNTIASDNDEEIIFYKCMLKKGYKFSYTPQ